MAFVDNGNYSADHTLLFLHGLFDHMGTWELVAPSLGEQFRTVAVDLVGSGRSSKPPFTALPPSQRYSLDQQVAFVREFICVRKLHNIVIVGSSFGGVIALRLICGQSKSSVSQDADGLDVGGLVLVSAAGYPQPLPDYVSLIAGKPGALLLNRTVQRLIVASGLAKRITLVTYARAFHDPSRIPDGFVDRAVNIFAQPGTPYAYRMSARNLVPPDIDTFPQKYKNMQLPTLIVWGKDDRIVPALSALRFKTDLPQAKLHVFEDCGHAPHLEYPDETAIAIRDWIRYTVP